MDIWGKRNIVERCSVCGKEVTFGMVELEDGEKICYPCNITLNESKDKKSIENGKPNLRYMDLEMYKFIF